MDAFGDNFVNNELEVDPAAEFLAREQDQLAGLEVEIPPMTAAAPTIEGKCRTICLHGCCMIDVSYPFY